MSSDGRERCDSRSSAWLAPHLRPSLIAIVFYSLKIMSEGLCRRD